MIIDGYSLTPSEVAAVARGGEQVELDSAVRGRVRRDRVVVEDAVARGVPVYGLTTGLGARATFTLPAQELAGFSVRTVRGRANAVGPPLPREVIRAALLVRCNCLAHGGSGVQPAVLDLLLAMLASRVHPVVPQTGSIGASDLGQMAHIGLAAIGEGSVEYRGEILPAGVALKRAGLTPAALGPKDGLGLCNSSALSAAGAALAYDDARKLLAGAQLVTTLSFEGFRANATPLDPRVQAARPLAGAQACAAQMRELLAGGQLLEAGAARRLQDPLSFRCAPQVHGAFRAAMGLLTAALDPELNGAGDNPLVLADDHEILSTGNFNTAALALALDTVALAVFQTPGICAQRAHRLLASSLTDLPENLSPHGSEQSGYAPLIKTAQSLLAELRHLSFPLSTDPDRARRSWRTTQATPQSLRAAPGRCSTGCDTCWQSRCWSQRRQWTSRRPGRSDADPPRFTGRCGSASRRSTKTVPRPMTSSRSRPTCSAQERSTRSSTRPASGLPGRSASAGGGSPGAGDSGGDG